MNISIEITSKRSKKIEDIPTLMGRITIGNTWESIYVPINLWNKSDYERQWKEGLERLKTHNKSCLVVGVYDPKKGPAVEWWKLYRVGDMVYINNGWLAF